MAGKSTTLYPRRKAEDEGIYLLKKKKINFYLFIVVTYWFCKRVRGMCVCGNAQWASHVPTMNKTTPTAGRGSPRGSHLIKFPGFRYAASLPSSTLLSNLVKSALAVKLPNTRSFSFFVFQNSSTSQTQQLFTLYKDNSHGQSTNHSTL